MDSDNELFITQSKISNESSSEEEDLGEVLKSIAHGTLECSEITSKTWHNAPLYGIEFSDISDNEGLVAATQEAEQNYEKRFGQPVTEEKASIALRLLEKFVGLLIRRNILKCIQIVATILIY